MLRYVLPCSLADQLRSGADLKHIVKAHKQQCIEHNIHIVQIVELAVQGWGRKRHRVFILLHHIQLIIGRKLCMVGANPYALTAVNAEFVIDTGLAAPHPEDTV